MLIDIKQIYLQEKAKEYPATQKLLDKYSSANVTEVKSHWKIPELNNNQELLPLWNKVKKEYLVIGVMNSMKFKDNGRSTDFVPPSIANGCAMACTYCYVARRKGYANPVTTFVNIEEIKESIKKHLIKLGPKTKPNQCDPKYWTYDIGCNNDASVDALISNNTKEMIDFFKQSKFGKATFATKYVNREMLSYDPQKKTRIRFSLMPHRIAKLVDVRCSPVKERIQAINDFCEAGYEVHLNFSPVILYPNWPQDYALLMEELNDSLSYQAKKQLACEVIFLTHNESLHQLNMQWHPKAEQLLWTPHNQEQKVSLYGGNNLRYQWKLKANCVEEFKNLSNKHMPYMDIRYIF